MSPNPAQGKVDLRASQEAVVTISKNPSTKRYLQILITFIIFILLLTPVFMRSKQKATPEQKEYVSRVENQLISTFPTIVVFPGSSIKYSYEKEEAGKVGYEASWETDVPAREVMEWYIAEIEQDNVDWTIIEKPENLDSGELFLVAGYKGRKVNLTVEEEGGKTQIIMELPFMEGPLY